MGYLVADLSNSRTKIAPADRDSVGKRVIIPTPDVSPETIQEALKKLPPGEAVERVILSSVVPEKSQAFREVFGDLLLELTPEIELGVAVDFPDPSTIGPDRLANAAAAAEMHGVPSLVVDFGTAVTFDVISADRAYVGGVIAPGLSAMTDYLHERTALLPRIKISEPKSAIGKSTETAMLAGAVIGYRGLVKEILYEICDEMGVKPSEIPIIATGGYADLIAEEVDLIDIVDPNITLEGLRIIANLNAANQ